MRRRGRRGVSGCAMPFDFWEAIALLLVIEGLLPAISPKLFRKSLFMMAQMDRRSIRVSGLASMVVGALLLYLLRH